MPTPGARDLRQAALDYHAQAPAGKLAACQLVDPRLAVFFADGLYSFQRESLL